MLSIRSLGKRYANGTNALTERSGCWSRRPAARWPSSALLFVAALAVAGASLTAGGKLFSGVCVALWYTAVNRVPDGN